MFCSNCGTQHQENDRFCLNCGRSLVHTIERPISATPVEHALDSWWFRLSKVFYILLYFPLIAILAIVWEECRTTYNVTTNSVDDTLGAALFYSLITVFIYLTVMKLLKVAFIYIAFGKRPNWRKELKKFF